MLISDDNERMLEMNILNLLLIIEFVTVKTPEFFRQNTRRLTPSHAQIKPDLRYMMGVTG